MCMMQYSVPGTSPIPPVGSYYIVAYVCTSDGVLRTMDNYHVTRICKK